MDCYIKNHNPKYSYLEDIRTFKIRKDLPKELYELDILDWSPPCSSFSMAGNREEDWWKEKKFREWQAEQTLDDLFFDFIDLAKELQPKVVLAENVKWLLLWEAWAYVQRIYKEFDEAWYHVEHYLLNAKTMWVPQSRERVFFIGVRKDQSDMIQAKDMFNQWPKLKLEFNETPIYFWNICDELWSDITEYKRKAWEYRKPTDRTIANSKENAWMKVSDFNCVYLRKDEIMPTITWKGRHAMLHYDKPIMASDWEIILWWSFPLDYNYLWTTPWYIIGMSVPPVMIAQIANQIALQLFNK